MDGCEPAEKAGTGTETGSGDVDTADLLGLGTCELSVSDPAVPSVVVSAADGAELLVDLVGGPLTDLPSVENVAPSTVSDCQTTGNQAEEHCDLLSEEKVLVEEHSADALVEPQPTPEVSCDVSVFDGVEEAAPRRQSPSPSLPPLPSPVEVEQESSAASADHNPSSLPPPSSSSSSSNSQRGAAARSRSLGSGAASALDALPPADAALVVENERLRTEIEGWRRRFAGLESRTRDQFSLLEGELMGRIAQLEADKRRRLDGDAEAAAALIGRRRRLQQLVGEKLAAVRARLDGIGARLARLPDDKEETRRLLSQLAQSLEEDFVKVQNEFGAREEELKGRNSALIAEMNVMNEVIKQRGEKLAALEAKEEELKAEVDRLKARNEAAAASSSSPARSDAEVQVQISRTPVQSTSASARQQDSGGGGNEPEPDHVADTASNATSEMSARDQAARMREVDASLEEYSQKLKLLALKQKKRIAELEAERKAMGAELEKARGLNAVKFQNELDALQDALDQKDTELKRLRKDLDNAAAKIAADSNVIAESMEQKDRLSAEVSALRKTESQLAKDKKELEAKLIVAERLAQEREKLAGSKTAELDSALSKLSEAEIKVFKLEENLRSFQKEGDDKTRLEAQVADLEKTVADLKASADEKSEKAVVAEAALRKATADLKVTALALEKERERCRSLQDSVAMLKNDLRESRKREGELRTQNSQLASEVEELNRQRGALKSEVNLLQVEAEDMREVHRQREAELESELVVLRDSSETAKLELEKARKSLASVEADYESYKTRAKAVLRQHKQLKEDLERREEKEQADLAEQREKLRAEFEAAAESLRADRARLESEAAALAADKSGLERLLEDRAAELAAASESRRRLEAELGDAVARAEALDAALQEERLSKRLMLDAMSQRQQSVDVEKEAFQTTSTPDSGEKLAADSSPTLLDTSAAGSSDPELETEPEPEVDIRTMEREEGEGSECVAGPPADPAAVASSPSSASPTPIFKFIHGDVDDFPRSPTKLMPLDKLLVSDEAEYDRYSGRNRRESTASSAAGGDKRRGRGRKGSRPRSDEDEDLIRDLKSSNSELRRKVNHLSSLLNDSEATNAKLSELTDVLKEEIRKEQRNEERQKHLEQTEYIKNVFFKFLTLKAGNERERLIPVLTTMLRLSPQEKNCLLGVARGTDDEAAQQSGWGTYLGLWKQ